ncbi:hypothetical protein [Microcoleus sp. POL10_C6]|uniref:hypothetical protein n=1 Tax=Microcoleus sp. POL10_C6 TaxID=2818852 RepID=UPI002FD53F66
MNISIAPASGLRSIIQQTLIIVGNQLTAAICPIALLCLINPGTSAIAKNGKAKL